MKRAKQGSWERRCRCRKEVREKMEEAGHGIRAGARRKGKERGGRRKREQKKRKGGGTKLGRKDEEIGTT